MKFRAGALAASATIAMLIPVCGFSRGSAPAKVADFIVTAAPVYVPLAELQGKERFPSGAQLLLVHDGKAELLVPDFAATADAYLSFDGKAVLFAGKKSPSDPWQIWELALQDRSVRKAISTAGDAERPFYLPGGRLLWAERTSYGFQIESAEDGHQPKEIFQNPTAGPGVLPLTYLRASAFPTDILADGRILFEAGFPLGQGSTPELYLVYADGSGVESYRCDHGQARWGGMQLASGDVVFTQGTSLARFTSPMAHEVRVGAPGAKYAGAVAETAAGEWLLSARTAAGIPYAIGLWNPGSASKPGWTNLEIVLAMSGMNLIEPVLVAPHARPHRHPSGLHSWDYANLLALDSRLSRDGDLKTAPASVRLETLGADGGVVATGTAPVEADGSFFVETPVDRPIRFALLDRNGAVLRQEQGWFWTRGGEQRICVGCHTGPERSPENRVPAVLLRSTTPFDLTGQNTANNAKSITQGPTGTGTRPRSGPVGEN